MRRNFQPILILGPIVAGVAALAFGRHLQNMSRSLDDDGVKQGLALSRMTIAGRTETPIFIPHLPAETDSKNLLSHMQIAFSSNGIALESVPTWKTPATTKTLGRVGFAVELRGGYAQLKSAFADALDRFPNLTVKSMSFRRRSQATDVQAHVEFIALTRPELQPASSSQ